MLNELKKEGVQYMPVKVIRAQAAWLKFTQMVPHGKFGSSEETILSKLSFASQGKVSASGLSYRDVIL